MNLINCSALVNIKMWLYCETYLLINLGEIKIKREKIHLRCSCLLYKLLSGVSSIVEFLVSYVWCCLFHLTDFPVIYSPFVWFLSFLGITPYNRWGWCFQSIVTPKVSHGWYKARCCWKKMGTIIILLYKSSITMQDIDRISQQL